MRKLLLPLLATLPLLAGGCLARTAYDVATAPVRVVSQAADWATTSQDEADRNYGRRKRKEEAAAGRRQREEDRRRAEHRRDGDDGDDGPDDRDR